MNLSYVAKIKAKVAIFISKKSSNIFDGTYKSIYKGSGLNFEDLREYVPGDNVRDIDWKASSRSRNLLVKRYIAEKKHNVMLVFDTGKEIDGQTSTHDSKKDVLTTVGGTIGYIAARNGDNVGALWNRNGKLQFFGLKGGLNNLERILACYDRERFDEYESDLDKSLNYLCKYFRRRMIVIVMTDIAGTLKISETTMRRITQQHDLLFAQATDASITDKDAFSIRVGSYIPEFIASSKRIKKCEEKIRQEIREENERKLKRSHVVSVEIGSDEEVVDKVIELLEKHKYAYKS